MQVVMNGNQESLDKTISLSQFLSSKAINPETIVVEYNGEIIKKVEWDSVILQNNDRLEILKFVGGG